MCRKRRKLPVVLEPIGLTSPREPGSLSVMLLDKNCLLNRLEKPPKLTGEEVRGIMVPVPCGYSPLLLIAAPEEGVTLIQPSVSDILSSILGSLLPDLAAGSENLVLSRLRLYQDAGK